MFGNILELVWLYREGVASLRVSLAAWGPRGRMGFSGAVARGPLSLRAQALGHAPQ